MVFLPSPMPTVFELCCNRMPRGKTSALQGSDRSLDVMECPRYSDRGAISKPNVSHLTDERAQQAS